MKRKKFIENNFQIPSPQDNLLPQDYQSFICTNNSDELEVESSRVENLQNTHNEEDRGNNEDMDDSSNNSERVYQSFNLKIKNSVFT